jgi:hypothetical protein
MCQRLYVASDLELPVMRRGAGSPFLEVRRLPSHARIPAFPRSGLDHVYVAGGHVECGCGFPDVLANGGNQSEPVEPADLRSLQALAEWLRPACGKRRIVRLYLCWAGHEADPPESELTICLAGLRASGFRLRHKQVLTISGVAESRRRPTRG